MKENISYRGCSIVIDYDDYMNCPRDEYSNLGVIYSNSYRFNPDNRMLEDYFDKEGEIDWKTLQKDYIYLRVYIYEHGGIVLYCRDENEVFIPRTSAFDTALYGVIAVSKEQARKEYGRLTKKKVQKIKDVLRGEIEELSAWYEGECYSYKIIDNNGNLLDSCCGFLGDAGKKYAIDYAKGYIDSYVYDGYVQTELFASV